MFIMSKSKMIIPSIEDVKHLQIPLQDIVLATKEFARENFIGYGAFGKVYKGVFEKHGDMAVKRFDSGQANGRGNHEFKTEITLLSKYKHENIVCLLGFCDEDDEKIIVYKYESNGSLDKHVNNKDLNWIQRLRICLDVARALKYLHDDVGCRERVLHRDVKSSNILLDQNWKAKLSDFGLSRVGPANMKPSFVISNVCGTPGYIDPEYYINGYLTLKSDVYSFGVVLWEVLCGRLAHVKEEGVVLSNLVQRHYISRTLHTFIPSYLHNQISTSSLDTFSSIAYQCLKNVAERPTMKQVMEQLQKALDRQLEEEEVKSTARYEKKEDLNDPSPHIILSMFMDCEGCAIKVKRCLKGFEGVKDVVTDCKTHQIVVKGENANPLKVLERVQKKIHRKVELLLPVSNQQAEDPKKLEQGEPSKLEEKKYEVVKKPKVEKKAKDEENPVARDKKKGNESKDLSSPQEIVLSVFLHCEGCAGNVRKRLRHIIGVENVTVNCKTQKVIVKGKADPLKVLQIVQMGIHEKVELLSPVLQPSVQEPEKPEQEEPPTHEDKKYEPRVITVVLEVPLHCEGCALKTRNRIWKMKGVESVATDLSKSQVVVKGIFSAEDLAYVQKETGKNAVIVKQEPADDDASQEQ